MKRYAVFAFDDYYPVGGWCDHRASFEALEEALEYAGAQLINRDRCQIVDLLTGEVIERLPLHAHRP